jgi:hypothetical protein
MGGTSSKQMKGDRSIHLKPGKQAEFLGLLIPDTGDRLRHESTFVNNFLHQDPNTGPVTSKAKATSIICLG